MSVSQLKQNLNERASESRRRLQKMRQICTSIETTVKESRGLAEVQSLKEEIKKEFIEFALENNEDEV